MADAKSPDQEISEKLRTEREKALEVLEKSQSPLREITGNISYLFRPHRSTETSQSARGSNSRNPYCLSVNLSDLAEDKTIDLEDQPEKLTFDPTEITGRSTMLTRGQERRLVRKTAASVIEESFEDILATSRCQNVRELSKSCRESLISERGRHGSSISFHSDDFISSDNMKRNLLSEDEREWEKEFFAIPGSKLQQQQEIPVDFDGFSGFIHNITGASDQFSLGAFCNKQSEFVRNIIRAGSPTQEAQCLLSTSLSSVASGASAASAIGKTYTANSRDVEHLIEGLNLSESTNKILVDIFKKDSRMPSRKAPLDDITSKDANLRVRERMSEDMQRGGKENRREEKEYREFCQFNSSKSPRRNISQSILLSGDSTQETEDRRSSTLVEPIGARKRSRSSVYGKAALAPAVVEYRRAKSPSNVRELRVISGAVGSPSAESTATGDRMFLCQTPMDSGKMSLPNYALVKGDAMSPGGSAGLTRTTSQMSTASEFNHREGYLPLKATHGELSWGSVRLRTSVKKSIQIKNTAAKRLTFRAVIDGPGFQFGSADAPQMTLSLQPQECRSLWIVFGPTVRGPAVGKLVFKPPTADNIRANRVIPLYGYGGHATVSIEGLQQGPVGSKFLPMGDIKRLMRCFEETITAYNRGPLSAFVNVNVENARPDQRYFTTSVNVTPSKVIIPPSCYAKITIQFKPQKDELKKLLKMQKSMDVIVIANLIVITGDEPTRHRVKKLIRQIPNHALTTTSALASLWNNFPREQETDNLEELRENALAIADLTQGFRSTEIALTINNGTDDTVMDASGWVADFEETILFQTITPGTEPDDREEEASSEEIELFKVEPQEIVWETVKRESRKITLKSLSRKLEIFEIETNQPHLVEFFPAEGEILPEENFTILLKLIPGALPKNSIRIKLKIAQQVITIPIHVGRASRR